MEEEGMGVGAGLFLCFHLIHKGRGEGGHGSGLIPSFLFISFCLVVSLQSWLPSPQLARPLSTQPLPPLRSGGLPGSQVGPSCVVEFVDPACLPCAPALRPHPAVGTALGWGLQYLLRHQQQSWRWFSGLTTGTPGCASPSAPPAPNTPPHPWLVRLRLHPLCPWGNPTRTL